MTCHAENEYGHSCVRQDEEPADFAIHRCKCGQLWWIDPETGETVQVAMMTSPNHPEILNGDTQV
jgi:hypothetical protein